MPNIKRPKKAPKNKTNFLVFVSVILGVTILFLLVLSIDHDFRVESPVSPPPVALAAVAEQESLLLNGLPIVVPVVVSIKDATPKVAVLRAHLIIPKIGVDAVIKDMGLTSAGLMAVPSNNVDVGWFSLGTRPGETGSAVIGAHIRFGSEDGVFVDLDKLQKGDLLSVVNANGVSTFFVVQDMRTYDAKDANTGIFESENGVHLNLVTCSGDWNALTKNFNTRLVVFTDAVNTVGTTDKVAMVLR